MSSPSLPLGQGREGAWCLSLPTSPPPNAASLGLRAPHRKSGETQLGPELSRLEFGLRAWLCQGSSSGGKELSSGWAHPWGRTLLRGSAPRPGQPSSEHQPCWPPGVLVSEERGAGVPRRWLEGLRNHFHFLPPPHLHCLGLHLSVSLLHRKPDGETCEPPLLGEGWPQGTMAFPEGSSAIGQPVSGCCTGPSRPQLWPVGFRKGWGPAALQMD